MDQIKILIADEVLENRVALKKSLFAFEKSEVVGETGDGEECLKLANDLHPDIILIDVGPLGGTTGIDIAEQISLQIIQSSIVMITNQTEDDTILKQAMLAGARHVLYRPFNDNELFLAVEHVYELNKKKKEYLEAVIGKSGAEAIKAKIITVFSTKGGVGRSLLATNLSVAIKKLTGKKVLLLDLGLQFGDVSIMMNIKPRNTLSGLAKEVEQLGEIDSEVIGNYISKHESGVDILPSPLKPEESDMIKGEHIQTILKTCATMYHYIVIDTPSYLQDAVLTSLEMSDIILLLLTMELPTIKNGKLMLEIMERFQYSTDKVKLIMNRDTPNKQFKLSDIEETLGREILVALPSDGLKVMPSIDEGEPVVLKSPDSIFSKGIFQLARVVAGSDVLSEEAELEGLSEKEKKKRLKELEKERKIREKEEKKAAK